MEKQADLETKYQKLATEYSKVRSQASVLKKALLDEQAKNTESKEIIKNHEQTIRKHDQEMESLTFRNEQLTKRISVLQEELQVNSHSKKGKPKNSENIPAAEFGVLNEELQKKIMENAQLLSSISDKDIEIVSYKERVEWLEDKLIHLEKELSSRDEKYRERLEKLQKDKENLGDRLKSLSQKSDETKVSLNENNEKFIFWKAEAEKWQAECDLLRSKPSSNEELTDYYESQLREVLEAKILALSEAKSLTAENLALKARLENLALDYTDLQNKLEKSYEELGTTNENYRSQLDAMTEHLAAQNEKITRQCDEIQILKHRLSTSKK